MIEDRLRRDVPLAARTTFEVGGPAAFLLEVDEGDDVCEALAWARARGVPVFVLGGGSNLLVAERGFAGLVVQVCIQGFKLFGERVLVGAGESLDGVVERAGREGLSGLECLSGIPGTIGATPVQNVGAYGQEIGDAVTAVRAIDRASGELISLPRDACEFSYRGSAFKRKFAGRFVITEVELLLDPSGAPSVKYPELAKALSASPTLADVRNTVMALRRSKSMVVSRDDPNRRSAGSFFVNPVVAEAHADAIAAGAPGLPRYPAEGGVKLSAAWLIEQAGFAKGSADGAVGLSTRHALAIVNRGGATGGEIVRFAGRVRTAVRMRFGVLLEHEPVLLGFEDCDLEAAGLALR
jgi:UDP-N-acetylmuramate dehydrogenase